MPDMAKTYDEQAQHFAKFAPESFTFVHIERPAYDRYISITPGTRVLDIGAGSGRMAQYLVSRGVSPENITGLEISPKLVELAKQAVPGVNFLCGDARDQIWIPKGSLDLITSHMVLEFLDPKGLVEVLKSIKRMLKPNGDVCVITTHPSKMTKKIGIDKPGWFETKTPWGDKVQNWFRTTVQFHQAFYDAGLSYVTMEDLHVPVIDTDDPYYAHVRKYDPMRLLIKARG